jgi:hypothetical protein
MVGLMAWTQSDLDKISKAIATGARRVRFQTHEVEYRSLAEMMAVKREIESELSGSSSGGLIFTEFGTGA